MPKLLKLLDELEQAIPEMRDMLGADEEYMEGEEDEGLPPLPEDEGAPEDMEMMPEGGEDEAMDLETPPPFPGKKKKPALPF